jgi:hypothetical protein
MKAGQSWFLLILGAVEGFRLKPEIALSLSVEIRNSSIFHYLVNFLADLNALTHPMDKHP